MKGARPRLGAATGRGRRVCGAVLCATVVALTFAGSADSSQVDPTPEVLDYSGLGDSYSAGEGVTPYDLDTDTLENSCHRSENAYAHLIQAWLDAEWTAEGRTEPFDSVDLDFLACSGALMRHVVPGVSLDDWPSECGKVRTSASCGWFKTESPQLRRMESWSDLVTLTISGNDAHFADILKDCFAERDCRHRSPTWVPSDPQNDTEECIARQDRDDYEQFLDGVVGCLSDELTVTLTAIRERAPGAAVFVLSYPQLFPDTKDEQNCASLDYQGWQLKSTLGWRLEPYEANRALAISGVKRVSGVSLEIPHFWQSRFAGSNFPFSNDEQVFLREKTLELNDVVESAAADAGVHFVDVDPYFTNHEICGDGRGWIRGFVPLGRKNDGSDVGWKIWKKFSVPGSASFHPNALGQEAYATAFQDYVLRESCGDLLPSGLPANPPPGGGVSTTAAPATSTSLVIDTSGSMSRWTGDGERKIAAARRAAHDVVTLAETDQTPARRNQVGLVEFYTEAREVAPPTCGLGVLRGRIDELHAEGDTDLGAGLQLGIDQVASSAGDKAVILLSDGVPTEGLESEDVLATVVPDAVANDVRVFTVGFGQPGDPDDLDEELLRAIARRTGGEYGYASSPFGLRSVFIRARQSTTGDVVAEKKGMVAEGETQKAASWSVAEGEQGEMEIALAWPGSDLDIVLEDPSGEVVDAG